MQIIQPTHQRATSPQQPSIQQPTCQGSTPAQQRSLCAGTLQVLDARPWTRLVHFIQAKKRFLEIPGPNASRVPAATEWRSDGSRGFLEPTDRDAIVPRRRRGATPDRALGEWHTPGQASLRGRRRNEPSRSGPGEGPATIKPPLRGRSTSYGSNSLSFSNRALPLSIIHLRSVVFN